MKQYISKSDVYVLSLFFCLMALYFYIVGDNNASESQSKNESIPTYYIIAECKDATIRLAYDYPLIDDIGDIQKIEKEISNRYECDAMIVDYKILNDNRK